MAWLRAYIILVTVILICTDLEGRVAPLDEVQVTKRADIDLKTCVDNFAVHKDKIIRTQDSRQMGAKYLNEIDLDTREECLRLCCETDNCDVFVYEEKNVGSCYLFQCGPPEDFKCKFTHHVNYSSGVLTVNRRLPDLESQIKLTKHEDDLSKLRQPGIDPSAPQAVSEANTTPSTVATTTRRRETLEPAPNTKATSESKCSRFQFECRSNSECIAIYNACDGIPQCSDGSDEAPELGCPETLTTSPAPISKPNNSAQTVENPSPHLAVNPPNQDVYRVTNQRQSIQAQNPPRQEDFLRPIPDSRNLISSSQYDPQQGPINPYGPYQQQQQQNWISRQSNQLLSQLPQYTENKNSHIFNHKEVGLQVPEGSETRYNTYKGAMHTLHRALGYSNSYNSGQAQPYNEITNHEYPKVPSYYGEIYRQPMPQMPDTWSNNQDYRNGPYAADMNVNSRDPWRQNLQPSQQDAHESRENPNAQRNLTPSWKPDEKNPTHVQNKMAHELKEHSKEHKEAKALSAAVTGTASSDGNDGKAPKDESKKRETPIKYAMAGLAERLELQDGIAEAPGGAILSLTLGLIITCLMAILIGCRLRVVRRRMRRGGKSYAHDADYLVNGMYL